jgi:hypothetical protein
MLEISFTMQVVSTKLPVQCFSFSGFDCFSLAAGAVWAEVEFELELGYGD